MVRLRPRPQSRHARWRFQQWLPPGDGPSMGTRLGIVRDPGKPLAQLNGGGQLAVAFEHFADGNSISFGDDEHHRKMALRKAVGKHRERKPDSHASGVRGGVQALGSAPPASLSGIFLPTHRSGAPVRPCCARPGAARG
jgi:hypothetical protein